MAGTTRRAGAGFPSPTAHEDSKFSKGAVKSRRWASRLAQGATYTLPDEPDPARFIIPPEVLARFTQSRGNPDFSECRQLSTEERRSQDESLMQRKRPADYTDRHRAISELGARMIHPEGHGRQTTLGTSSNPDQMTITRLCPAAVRRRP